ncbi:putative FAD-linked oxidoreductase [compost metagenome]
MSKIAQYLNEHISGEVSTKPEIRATFSTDASFLAITPEMVVYPRVTNDIRKVARFAWQLAEKGHSLTITARGGGSDLTGAAIGKGIILNTTAHLTHIFELDVKQKLVRLQPGVMFKTLNDALQLHGLHVPSAPISAAYSTVGGAIANNSSGLLSGTSGTTLDWVHQLEVVLANGDILQTERINKRELNRRKGLQTLEGEIYRQIDGLIVDNEQLIHDKIATDVVDGAGYAGLAKVKHRDGSFDLTPLLVGSQGTLGLISEVIMKADFINRHHAVGVAAFESREAARDAADELAKLQPTYLEYIDGRLFAAALARGKTFTFYRDGFAEGTVLVFGFADFSERARARGLKKAEKLLQAKGAFVTSSIDQTEAEALAAAREVTALHISPEAAGDSTPPIFDGAYIPLSRFEDFTIALEELASKHHVQLPLYGNVLSSVYSVRPVLQLKKVGDRQKILKLLAEYADLVENHKGHLIGQGGEGRAKASFAYKHIDDDITALYDQVRQTFDPYGTLNAGVKQTTDLKTLVSQLRDTYDMTAFAQYSPYN